MNAGKTQMMVDTIKGMMDRNPNLIAYGNLTTGQAKRFEIFGIKVIPDASIPDGVVVIADGQRVHCELPSGTEDQWRKIHEDAIDALRYTLPIVNNPRINKRRKVSGYWVDEAAIVTGFDQATLSPSFEGVGGSTTELPPA